ncbi:MAG: alkaline phosphatase [Mycobacterium sp.]|jgi:alkaline phosphatase|nr:alkaline phosphatase [Mycobacterium sp.]
MTAACTADKPKQSNGDSLNRSATGNLTEMGGARRLNGDQSEVIRNAINSSGYPGLTRVRTTKDGADMTVSYGTSIDTDVFSETHTGAQLPVAAYGPRAANVVALTDQTDLFFTMRDALGVNTR